MSDISKLGDVELSDQASLFKASEIGRKGADELAFALEQFYSDIVVALSTIPVIEGKADRKARRVARHARRARDQILAVRESMKKIPHEFVRTYEPELRLARDKAKKKFNLDKEG